MSVVQDLTTNNEDENNELNPNASGGSNAGTSGSINLTQGGTTEGGTSGASGGTGGGSETTPGGADNNQVTTPGSAGSGALSSSSNNSSTQNPNSNAALNNGGGIVNLSQYLQANQPEVNQLSGQVGQWLQGQAQNANQAITSAGTNFNNTVGSNTINLNQDLLNQATSNPTAFVGSSTAQNPNANLAALLAQENAVYQGPANTGTSATTGLPTGAFEGWSGYAPLAQQVNQVDQYGNDITSQQGLSQILQAMNQGGLYSSGNAAVDLSLLGSTPTSNQILQEGAAPASQLNAYLNQTAQAADQAAQQAGLTTQQTAQAVQQALGTAYQNFQNTVNNETTAAQNTATQNDTALQTALGSNATYTPGTGPAAAGTVNDTSLAMLGITPAQYQQLQSQAQQFNTQYGATQGNFDLGQYLSNPTPVTQAVNANNAATAQDYATQAALALENPNAGYGSFITTPNAAGTAPTSDETFNTAQAQTGVQQALQAGANAAQAAAQQGAEEYHLQKQQEQASNPLSGGNILKTLGTIVSVVSAC